MQRSRWFLTRCIGISAALLVALPVLAKRTSDYVPPPYPIRVAQSFGTLFAFALPGLAVAIIVARRRATDLPQRVIRAIIICAVIVFGGSMMAATDALNDELWNPIFYGWVFVAASFPTAVITAVSREDPRRMSIAVMSILLAFPLGLLIDAVGIYVVIWALEHGIPATW